MKQYVFFIFSSLCTISALHSMKSELVAQNFLLPMYDITHKICETIAEIPPLGTLPQSTPGTVIDVLSWYAHVQYPFVVKKRVEPIYPHTDRVSDLYRLGCTNKEWENAVKMFFKKVEDMCDYLAKKINIDALKTYYNIRNSLDSIDDQSGIGPNNIDAELHFKNKKKDTITLLLNFSFYKNSSNRKLFEQSKVTLLREIFEYTIHYPKRFSLLMEFINNCTSVDCSHPKNLNQNEFPQIKLTCRFSSILPLIVYISHVEWQKHIPHKEEIGKYKFEEYEQKVTDALHNASSLEAFHVSIKHLEQSCFLLPTGHASEDTSLKFKIEKLIQDSISSYFNNEYYLSNKEHAWKQRPVIKLMLTHSFTLLENELRHTKALLKTEDIKTNKFSILKDFLYAVAQWKKPYIPYIFSIIEAAKQNNSAYLYTKTIPELVQLLQKAGHTKIALFLNEQYKNNIPTPSYYPSSYSIYSIKTFSKVPPEFD